MQILAFRHVCPMLPSTKSVKGAVPNPADTDESVEHDNPVVEHVWVRRSEKLVAVHILDTLVGVQMVTR
jgi:hypothetical protein